jgi:hypothetical protein
VSKFTPKNFYEIKIGHSITLLLKQKITKSGLGLVYYYFLPKDDAK